MGPIEQVSEDAEEGRLVLDGPLGGLREVAVEVERPFGNPRLRIDPKIEA